MKTPGDALPPVIGIVGWKNSGKTTLAVRLIATFTARGYHVASVKHAHHSFDIDTGSQDSARHRAAGARQVAVVSPLRWAVVSELNGADEPDFADVLAMLGPADLIVVEGYKSHPILKIEARRQSAGSGGAGWARGGGAIADTDPHVIAIAADHEVTNTALPTFDLDAVDSIADFVTERLGLPVKEA